MWRPRDRERFIGSYDPEHEMPDPDRDPGDRWQSDAYRRGARDTRYGYRFNPDSIENRYEGTRRDVDAEREARWRGDARDRDYGRGGYGGDEHRDRYGGGYGAGSYGGGREGGYGRGSYGGGYEGGYGRGGFGGDYDGGYGRGAYGGGRYDNADRYASDRFGGGYDRGYDRGFDRGWNRDFDRDREYDRGGFMTGPHFDRDRPWGSDRGWDNDRDYDRGGDRGGERDFGRGSYDDWGRWRRR